MEYEKIRQYPDRFQALTTLQPIEFDQLLPVFERELRWILAKTHRKTPRLNRFQWCEQLPSAAHHLFFLLTYLKESPTQEFHGAIFNLSQESAGRILRNCLKAFNETLTTMKMQPCTNGEDLADFAQKLKARYPGQALMHTQDMLLDGTEIRVQRPQDTGEQEDNYSGKRKTHTVKKLVINLFCGFILFASNHFVGSQHDKSAADAENFTFPLETYLWTDTGFLGYQNPNAHIVQPIKKPKGGALTDEQKQSNQLIASFRIANEHAIGGLKRCRIMKDALRLHSSQTREMIFSACAGLHNWRIHNRVLAS